MSGLSSAFYFLQSLSPKIKSITKVIILEKQARTGGWCHSVEQKQIDGVAASVNDNGSTKSIGGKGSNSSIEEVFSSDTSSNDAALVFETGPRSIRPVGLQGWLTVDMVRNIFYFWIFIRRFSIFNLLTFSSPVWLQMVW